MVRIKIGLSGLNPTKVVLKALHIVGKLNGNAFFPTPDPSLITVSAATDTLADAVEAAQTRDSEKIAMRNVRFAELKELLKQLGSYVEDESKGSEEKIISSGFEVAQRGGTSGPLPAPINELAKAGMAISTIDLSWKRVKGARVYLVEINTTDPMNEANWQVINYTTKTHFTVTGLTTGQICFFRTKAIGVAGIGAASDPARAVVP
jgi:hypothetical protein